MKRLKIEELKKSCVLDEEDYIKQLRYCMDHGLICFEYHRRHISKEPFLRHDSDADIFKNKNIN